MREKRKQEATPPHRAGMTGSPAIELRSLCKAFGTLQAVDHLTLSVEQGEIFGLLGPTLDEIFLRLTGTALRD
jgi:ABC-type glutathione transport system ATPase component